MKRITLLLVTVIALFSLFSCNGNDKKQAEGNIIYGEGIVSTLITNMDISDKENNGCLNLIREKVREKTGSSLQIYGDTKPISGGEIIVGETERDVSRTAKELLTIKIAKAAQKFENYPDEESAREDLVGYAVYAKDGAVAIVWSDSHIFEKAINFFVDNYILSSSLVLEDGYLKTEIFSLSAFLEERGKRIQEEQFKALEEAIGEEYGAEIVTSLRRLYSIYKPEAVTWLANLYDPETGGFYYSNSARDNEGYLPDIESTYGALAFIEEMGMAEMFDNDYAKALPRWMLEKCAEWVQSLQDSDGYFYHPQWPKTYIYERGLQSRITRDRGSALSILRKVGYSPVYSTSATLDGRLSDSNKVALVSKVVPTAVLSQFESVASFRKYINDLDAEVSAIADPDARAGRLYAIGNEFQSTVSLVKQNQEYVEILHEFFKKHQDPNTGTWSSVLTFNATNSLHKIGYVYNALGLKFDYIYEMMDTVIEILSRDVKTNPISSGVDFANAWAAIEHIYSNIKISAKTPDEGEEMLSEMMSYVYANITTAIDATFSQLSGFVQQDGSIGYFRGGSSYTSQGCPSAVSGMAEGDVNGYGCASYSVTGYIAIALGYPEYEVKAFGEKERVEFVRIIEKLGGVVKHQEELSPKVIYTFEDGIIPEEIVIETGTNLPTDGASVSVEEIGDNRLMHIVAVDRNGKAGVQNHSVKFPINLTETGANAAVMEFDFCVYDDGSSAHYKMIEWAMRSNGTLVIYPTIGKTSAGKVMLYDSNAKAITELCNVGEKIRLRFEYFWAEGEYKIYVNDKFRAKSKTLYASSLTNMPLTEMSFYTPTSLYANYTIDNLRASRVSKFYDPDETVQYPKEPLTEDFEGNVTSTKYGNGYNVISDNGFSALYSDKYTNNGGATAVIREDSETGNKFLSVYAPKRANKEYSHVLKMSLPTQMAAEPNTYVFEASMKLNSVCPSKNFLQIVFVNNSSNYRYGQLNMSVDNNGVACLAGVPIGYFDEWFDLRMEYHFNEGLIRIYSNGLFMGEVTTFSESDTITDKKVSALESITDFSVGTINSGGAFSFSIDNMAISMQSIEYSKRDLESLPLPNPAPDNFIPTLPEPEPEPDPTPTPTPTPTPGGNNTPDLEFPGMEPPMDVPDDVTPGDPNLDDKEDMGDWTGALI